MTTETEQIDFDGYECETCLIQDQSVQIPRFLIEDERLFMSLMSMETWNNLSSESRQRLLDLLPQEGDIPKEDIIKQLLGKKNFRFGNPIKNFYRRLNDGSFHPDVSALSSLCDGAKYKDYLLRQKDYFSQLVFDILPSRQIALDVGSLLPEGVPLKLKPLSSRTSADIDRDSPSKHRVLSRSGLEYYRALAEVRQDVADDGETSSEDEAFPSEAPLRLKASGFSSSDPAALEIRTTGGRSRPSMGKTRGYGEEEEEEAKSRQDNLLRHFFVVDTLAPEMDPVSNDEYEDAASQRAGPAISPLASANISESQYKTMLRRHKRKRRRKPSDGSKCYRPDLDTDGIDLTDVIRRTEISIASVEDEELAP